VQGALELIAEQRAKILPIAHALEKRDGRAHALRRQVHGEVVGVLLIRVRQIRIAQHGGCDGVVDRWPVNVAAVVGLLDDGDAVFAQFCRNLLLWDDGRLGRGSDVLEPAIRAQMHAASGAAVRVGAIAVEHGQPPREQRRLPGVETIGAEVDVLRRQTFEIRRRQVLQVVDGVPDLEEQLRGGARQPLRRREKIADRQVDVADLRHHPVDARFHELPSRHRSTGLHVGEVLLAPDGGADQLQLLV
jgi:hypothetical protein